MDFSYILERLPHRYPFLFVDKVLELEAGVHGVGIKNITYNEPYFAGHFPEEPLVPGVLLIEMIAQMGAIVAQSVEGGSKDKVGYFAQVKNFKFVNKAVPGEQLRIEVNNSIVFGNYLEIDGIITKEAAVVAKGKLIVTNKDEDSGILSD